MVASAGDVHRVGACRGGIVFVASYEEMENDRQGDQ